MSAIVCGKRSFFEELTVNSSPKRIRCSSSSPVCFSPPRTQSPSISSSFHISYHPSHPLDQLAALFPDMDRQILERALEECGDDLDSAIRRLTELQLGSADVASTSDPPPIKFDGVLGQGIQKTNPEVSDDDNDSSLSTHLPVDGAEWLELFVKEMTSASDMDDARTRTSRALEVLEKSICARAGAEAAGTFQQENLMLKQQLQALIQENSILKRAVSIQHERQKEFDERNQELEHLKQLLPQYQEQLKTLEVNNYALTMHLKQAQQSSSIPGRFHPDVF